MSKISRYFIQPGVNFVDFSLDLQPDASLQGQTVVLRGSSLVDRVYVGHGLSVDFTASLGNTDLIFVAGTRADFTASLSGINLRLTHKSSPGTQITLGTGDQVIFADGWLSTTAMIDALKSGGTEPALNASLTASGTVAEVAARTLAGAQPPVSRVLGFASGTEGHTFGQVVTGMRLVLKGTPYADVVYVKPGTSVDFRNSLAGEDRVYLTGGWGDYSKERLNSNSMRLSRGNEGVEVSVGDRLFFADGSVLVQPALTAISANPNASTTDLGGNWDPTRTTPGLSVTPGTLALANFTDSGALANDFLSNDSTFDLSLTGSQAGTTAVYQVRAPGANTWTDLAGSAIVQVADGRYQYRVKVSDANGTTAYSNVLPANDGAIVIDQTAPVVTSSASATVLENAAAGSTVYTATATDAHALRFALKANNSDDASAFLIDSRTGVVTIKASPDFETQASYTFTVVATDAAGNTSERVVSLSVTNVDDNGPVFTSSGTATANPDHQYTFTVVATDGTGQKAEKRVRLSVTNVDDIAPVFTSPNTATAAENLALSTVVYTAAADEQDVVGTAQITYSLKAQASDDSAVFAMDGSTGAVRFLASPNFEAQSSYHFTVVATDKAGNAAEQAVTLAITDVNESPTAVALTEVTSRLDDTADTSMRTKVGRLDISDDALGTNTVTLSGVDANSFEVEAGVLYLKANTSLDAATQSSLHVTVNVQDDTVANSVAVTADVVLEILDKTPSTPPTMSFSDAGADAQDGITRLATISVGQIEPDATWQYSTDGGSTWAPGSSSSFELPAGTHAVGSVQVRQTDAAGNVSDVKTNAARIVIDLTPPDAPTLALASDSGTSSSDGVSKDGTITVSGLESGAAWQYSTDGGSTWAPGSGDRFSLAAGSHAANALQVQQTDVAGNASEVGQNAGAILIDASALAPTLALATDSGNSASDGVSNNGTVTVSGLEASATWQYSTNGGSTWATGTSSRFSLPAGNYAAHVVKVKQTDVAGNESPAGTNAGAIVIDAIALAPSLSLTSDVGTDPHDRITPAAEALVGSSGNDTLNGGGGIDRLYGGRGHDTFVLNDSDIAHLTNTTPGGPKARINGGGGMDTLRLSGGASLNLGSIPNPGVVSLNIQSRIESIERIDLAQDSAANGLTIGATDVADMSGMNLFNTDNGWRNLLGSPLTSTVRRHQVIVNGNANDSVTLDITDPDNLDVVGWERVMQQGSAALVQDSQNLRYEVWNHSHNASQLLIQQGIPVLPA